MATQQDQFSSGDYKYGFVTDVESEKIPKWLTEDTIRQIVAVKGEPGSF